MSSFVYNTGKSSNNLDWENDTLEVLLLKEGSIVNVDHATVAAVIAGSGSSAGDECDATNYARGTLASKTVTVDNTGDTADYDAADLTFTSLGGASNNDVVAAVIYKKVTNDSDSIPLICVQFGSTTDTDGTLTDGETTDGNNFVITWASPIADIA